MRDLRDELVAALYLYQLFCSPVLAMDPRSAGNEAHPRSERRSDKSAGAHFEGHGMYMRAETHLADELARDTVRLDLRSSVLPLHGVLHSREK